MLMFQIKRIISSEKWFNYIITFFFLKMPQLWVDQMMLNGEKKEDGLTAKKICKKTDTIKKSYKDMEQQALKGVHENETPISHHPSCKSSWYTLVRDAAVH